MANRKISELPLISALSGSQVGGSVIPVVVGGTTNQISAENFSKFMNAYAAQTGSANTFTANQTINANLSVTGTTAIGGNTTIGGTLVVAGRLTAEEFHTEITTASVIYSSGSTKFGDTSNDTHEFTGSIQIGGETLGNAGLNAFTASAGLQLSRIYQTTASIQAQTASLLEFTASQDGRNFTLSQVTGSFRGEIGGLEAYSASLKAAAIVSSSTQVQNYDLFALNSNLYTSTGSIKGEIAGIESYTASLKAAAIVSSSTQIQNYDVFALNSNLYTSTGSLIGITNGLMAYTSSNETWKTGVRGEISAIEAWTASLDNTYATDAQLYQLYQATRSLELLSGSMIGITNGLMAYTSSNETWKTGVRGEVSGIEAYTASLKGQAIVSSSTQIQNYDVFALNSNLYTSTGSIKGEIAGIESYTSSLKAAISVSGTNVQIIGDLNVNKLNVQYVSSSVLVTSGSNIFGDQSTDKHEFTGSVNIKDTLFINGDVIGLSGLNSSTASLIGITNELMALTASMKSQAIVSSSQQITEYNAFAVTSSANTFYGTQTISGSLRVTAPIRTNIISGGLDVNGGITGSVKGNLDGVAAYASLLAISSAGTTTDTTLYPTFTLSPVVGSYSGLYSHLSGSFFLNGVTRQVVINDGGLLVTGSLIANSGITGSLMATNGVVSSSQQITDYYKFAETASATTTFYGNVTASGNIQANQLYVGGATTSTGLIGASEAVVQNELGIQYGDATGTYMRLIANTANSNTAIQAGAFSGVNPSLDLIASEGSTAISIKSDAGVNFAGSITGSKNLIVVKAAIGSTVTPTIPLEVYGQQKWFTTTGDGSELRGLFNPGGAADDAQLTLYKADATTEGIKFNANGNSHINGGNLSIGNSTSISTNENSILIGATNSTNIGSIGSVSNYTNNGYYNGSAWKYINSLAASNYYQGSGTHTWRVAASGTAGNDITWKDVLSLSNSGQLTNTVSGSNGQFILYQQQASYNTDAMSYFHNNANASTSWNFLKMFSGYPDNTQDVEFVFRGDGTGYSDSGWTTPASDYAEYFESLNGEALPVGSTVVLVDNKIRVATESDTNIIGVIRPKGAALFLGNNEAQKWSGKYLKDDYGAYILDENGHRTLNPNYDSELTYVSRENRVEWNIVGLVGQIPITKGQVVNPNWIKMRDISTNVEEWLVK